MFFVFILGTVFGLLLERRFHWANHLIRWINKLIT